MHRLTNEQLTLQVLDPVTDEDRLGTRYVSGCYVYQVTDTNLGDLLSGPAFPAHRPPVFDGQGMPEAFRNPLGPVDGRQLVIGNSIIEEERDPAQMNTWRVHERCEWEVERDATQFQMSTRQALGDWSLRLERRLVLNERTVLTETRLTNDGTASLPLVWYAHPFLPWPADDVCCSFSFPTSLPDNPGFAVDGDGQILRIATHDWTAGQFVQIEGCAGHQMRARYHHPVTGQLLVASDFDLSQMPIWGNACTVSFEPFIERQLSPGTTVSWSLVYTF